jgi:hypothetical protein
MTRTNELIDRYIAAWNEADQRLRLSLIARTWTGDGSYIDPMVEGYGHSEIDALIGVVRERFPTLRFSLLGAVESHHDRLRFSWELGPETGEAVAKGTDFAELAEDGRIRSVTGFLDVVAV